MTDPFRELLFFAFVCVAVLFGGAGFLLAMDSAARWMERRRRPTLTHVNDCQYTVKDR